MRVLIIGAGGYGQVVADILLRMREQTGTVEPVGYLDDNPSLAGRSSLGLPILGSFGDIDKVAHDAVVVAIGDNAIRRRVFEQLRSSGEQLATARHPTAVVAPDVTIGPGTVLRAGLVVDTGTSIGSNVILNTSCSVSHHVRIADHAHVSFGALIGAELVVAEGAMVGMNATVISRRNIGAWAVVGAGACVTKSVPPRVTVVGVPARPIQSKDRGPETGASPDPSSVSGRPSPDA